MSSPNIRKRWMNHFLMDSSNFWLPWHLQHYSFNSFELFSLLCWIQTHFLSPFVLGNNSKIHRRFFFPNSFSVSVFFPNPLSTETPRFWFEQINWGEEGFRKVTCKVRSELIELINEMTFLPRFVLTKHFLGVSSFLILFVAFLVLHIQMRLSLYESICI